MLPTRSARLEAGAAFYGLGFARGGERLLTTGRTGDAHALSAWDTRTWSRVWSAPIRTSTRFVVAHDEAWVATSDPDRIALWNLSDGTPRASYTPSLSVPAALAGGRLAALVDVPLHRPDGTTVDEGTRLAIFNAETGVIESHFALHARVHQLVAAPDGARVLAIDGPTNYAGFALWDVSGRRLASFSERGSAVAFRPGTNEIILTGSFADGDLPVVLDAATGARLAVLSGAKETVAECWASAISPDGRWLATVHADQRDNHWIVDQRIFVWDLETRGHHQTVELDCHYYPNAAVFTRGRLLAVAAGSDLAAWEIDLDSRNPRRRRSARVRASRRRT